MIILGKNQTYEGELIISDQLVTDETAIRVSSILKGNKPKLRVVDLSRNHKQTYISGEHLGDAIKVNTTLKKLLLHNVNLGTKGANRAIEGIVFN